MLLIVTSVAPTFAMLADRVTGVPPAAAPPKLITGGVASSNPVGLIPNDVTGTATLPTDVLNVTSPLAAPGLPGANVTGTFTFLPAGSDSGNPVCGGSADEAVPTENPALDVVIAEMLRSVEARIVSVAVCWSPTVVYGIASGPPVNGVATGEPNDSRRPSSVPTYTRSPNTAGIENLVARPVDPLHRSLSLPFAGTASYARSWPLPKASRAETHNSALPDVVPCEVTTAADDPKPAGSFARPA